MKKNYVISKINFYNKKLKEKTFLSGTIAHW